MATPTPRPAGPQPSARLYPVVDVIDGDTIDIRRDGAVERLRLIGLDTPETVDPNTPDECYGAEASERAARLLSGQRVRIATDPTQDERDRYDRLLVYVYTEDGANYALETIRQGYGIEYTFEEPYQLQRRFRTAERQAEAAERGLWSPGTCGGNADLPVELPQLEVSYGRTLYVDAGPQFAFANFRAEPSTDAALLDELPNGTAVGAASSTVAGVGGDRFYPVRYGGREGFILSKLLSETRPAEPEPEQPDPPSGDCDPSYPDVCIPPPPPDLDCGQIDER